MHFELEHHGTTTPLELGEGQHLLGGHPEDAISLEGLPPGLLTLRIDGARLTVESSESLRVNDVWVPPRVSRLVLPGEVLGLRDEVCLRVLAPPAERGLGTVAMLKGLLGDDEAALPASRAATLTCLTGLDTGRTYPLADARVDIGRGTMVDVRLRDRTVSRLHARILREGDAFCVQDMDSPNGVYLNGQRVDAPTVLREADVIELGNSQLRFQAAVGEPSPVEQPTQQPPAPESPSPEPVELEPAVAAVDKMEAGRVGRRSEWWLMGLGATLTVAGLLALLALQR